MQENDKQGQQVSDQTGTSADNQASTAGETTGEATSAVSETQGEQADKGQSALTQEKQVDIGPKELPKELEPVKEQLLKDYYAKTREVAEQKRGLESVQEKARLLEELWNYPRFQEWYKAEQSHTQTPQQSLTEEQMTEFQQNPQKLQEYIDSRIEQKYGSSMNQTQEQLENIRLDKEFDSMATKYSDFDAINDAGLLDPYFDRGLDVKAAYAEYKLDNPGNVNANVAKKAAEIVNKSQLGSTEKPTGVTHPGAKVFKPKSLNEAMDIAFNATGKGEKFRFERPEKK